MTAETKRDLNVDLGSETNRNLLRDLTICAAATDGPWLFNGNEVVEERNPHVGIAGALSEEDNRFIAEARAGWPHAIKLATIAEAALTNTRAYVSAVLRSYFDDDGMDSHAALCDLRAGALSRGSDASIVTHDEISELYGELDEMEAENVRLRAALERMDDRKNPMMPRSEMARIAKEALDYGETTQESGT